LQCQWQAQAIQEEKEQEVSGIQRYNIQVGQIYDRADGTKAPVKVIDTTSFADVDDVVIADLDGQFQRRIDAFKLAVVRYYLRVIQ
jgi:hypothetical protein